jgi:pimeloyl-ACP methyl ester carboxylesterase
VGNSWGAYVVTRYALDHPLKTDRVFQIASGTIAQAMGLSHNLTNLPGLKAFMAYDGTRQKLREFLESILLTKPSDELVDARHAMASLPGAEAAHTAMRAFMKRLPTDPNLKQRFQIKERLPALTIPMQMVWGERDAFAPVEFAHGLIKLLPNVRIDILSNAGHQAQTDAPEEVNKLVLDFMLGKSS